jgi:hypothetical protein
LQEEKLTVFRSNFGSSGFCLDTTAKAAHGQADLFNKAA